MSQQDQAGVGGGAAVPAVDGPMIVMVGDNSGLPGIMIRWDPREMDLLREVDGGAGPEADGSIVGGPVVPAIEADDRTGGDRPDPAASEDQHEDAPRDGDGRDVPPKAVAVVARRQAQAAPASGCWVAVLGPVVVDGWVVEPDRRAVIELLCFMALHPGRAVPADEIRAALWPGDGLGGDASGKSLRNTASLLRRCIGVDCFPEAERGAGYRLTDDVGTDWQRFEDLVQASSSGGPREAETMTGALALVRGAPFDGVPSGSYGWAWSELLVSRMEVAITDAAHRLVSLSTASGDLEQAEWAALQGLAALPYDRRLWEGLLDVAGAGGRQKLARAWRDAQAVLGAEAADLQPLVDRLVASAVLR